MIILIVGLFKKVDLFLMLINHCIHKVMLPVNVLFIYTENAARLFFLLIHNLYLGKYISDMAVFATLGFRFVDTIFFNSIR